MAEPIETNAGDAFNPQVAFDADGNALAVWTQFGSHEYIWSNRYRAGIGWDTAALIQPDSADRGTGAQIAIDAHGNALAVWQAQQADGTHARVWSNRFE
jgi:hypothetical protein